MRLDTIFGLLVFGGCTIACGVLDKPWLAAAFGASFGMRLEEGCRQILAKREARRMAVIIRRAMEGGSLSRGATLFYGIPPPKRPEVKN